MDKGTAPLGEWLTIDTAPKGGGAEMVTDPAWVEPPAVLVYCENDDIQVARWDWYYADGGRGYDGGSAWVTDIGGERIDPTHWMPLPSPPPKEANHDLP